MDPLADFLPVQTDGPDATRALGRRLAAALAPGDVLALYGDLGAGKTHLVKGLAEGLGLDPDEVHSPTFVLVHEYPTAPPLFHFDAYRVEDAGAFVRLGFDEYAAGEGVCVVEWPERVEALLPPGTHRLRLTSLGGDRRRIEAFDAASGAGTPGTGAE